MTLRRSIDSVRRVPEPAGDPRPLAPDTFTGPDGRRWVVIGPEGGPVVFLPELDPVAEPPVETPDGLAGFRAALTTYAAAHAAAGDPPT
jgi:hypothetical protein